MPSQRLLPGYRPHAFAEPVEAASQTGGQPDARALRPSRERRLGRLVTASPAPPPRPANGPRRSRLKEDMPPFSQVNRNRAAARVRCLRRCSLKLDLDETAPRRAGAAASSKRTTSCCEAPIPAKHREALPATALFRDQPAPLHIRLAPSSPHTSTLRRRRRGSQDGDKCYGPSLLNSSQAAKAAFGQAALAKCMTSMAYSFDMMPYEGRMPYPLPRVRISLPGYFVS